jgi:hypothetical protein
MLAKSDDWYRQLISLGVQIAESGARRILALETQQVLLNAHHGRRNDQPERQAPRPRTAAAR